MIELVDSVNLAFGSEFIKESRWESKYKKNMTFLKKNLMRMASILNQKLLIWFLPEYTIMIKK